MTSATCTRCGKPVAGDSSAYRGSPYHRECWLETLRERYKAAAPARRGAILAIAQAAKEGGNIAT